jgi:para-aminobenzoate synthetase
MRTLLVDNYDSFTYNLFQYLAEVNGDAPLVIRNDELTLKDIGELQYDNIVISPGPGRPEREADFGVCRELILAATVPLLGVCLGHQGICAAFGGRIDYADVPVHGRTSAVHHSGDDLFANIPSPFTAVRYHSLIATELPPVLDTIAWTESRINMGLRHRLRPIWGVQFHPESIGTEFGKRLLTNFRDLTRRHAQDAGERTATVRRPRRQTPASGSDTVDMPADAKAGSDEAAAKASRLELRYRKLPQRVDSESLFIGLFGDVEPAIWLDAAGSENARFSYLGDATGPHAEQITYDVAARRIEIRTAHSSTHRDQDIFSYLDAQLRLRAIGDTELPFSFNGGYVGYIGYEAKADCGGSRAYHAETPDAAFVFVDRFIAIDHAAAQIYIVCLDGQDEDARACAWLDAMIAKIETTAPADSRAPGGQAAGFELRMRHSNDEYRRLIEQCHEAIRLGESYEICLTNSMGCTIGIDSLNAYRELRSRSPAPYASYLRLGGIAVLSSSPERFLRVDRQRIVESKPIKGTRRRGATLVEDESLRLQLANSDKDRAENLMIVDLVRHDLGSVCVIGSVEVPLIFAVESYATVHQLVSTVRGRLKPGVSAVGAARAAFPPGSMTGAPKIRTMQIIDRLEGGPRGVYSGAIGWFALNGAADLGVAIRTIVVQGDTISIGAGGAVVALSDPDSEVDEMLLKLQGTLQALRQRAVQLRDRQAARSAATSVNGLHQGDVRARRFQAT